MLISRRNMLIAALSCGASAALKGTKVHASSKPRMLTACFSRTGNTAAIAAYIREITGSGRFDIVPAKAYPEDYETTVAQARRERARNYRPALLQRSVNIREYDVILLGYPIWAMTLPPVMRTFLDEHNLSGKTVAPFCTHKGYGRGESMQLIRSMAPEARILEGFDIEGVQAQSAKMRIEQWLQAIHLS